MSASCVLRQEVLDTDAAIPPSALGPLPPFLKESVVRAPQRVPACTICVPVPNSNFPYLFSISFFFLLFGAAKLLAPLAYFVPLSSNPAGTHELGGVSHHAFSHCHYDRHVFHVLFRDLPLVGPGSCRVRTFALSSGTLFRLGHHCQCEYFSVHAFTPAESESQQA